MLLVDRGRETQVLLKEPKVVESIFLLGRLRPGSGLGIGPYRQEVKFSCLASSLELETFPEECN